MRETYDKLAILFVLAVLFGVVVWTQWPEEKEIKDSISGEWEPQSIQAEVSTTSPVAGAVRQYKSQKFEAQQKEETLSLCKKKGGKLEKFTRYSDYTQYSWQEDVCVTGEEVYILEYDKWLNEKGEELK